MRYTMKKILLLLALLALPSPASAQALNFPKSATDPWTCDTDSVGNAYFNTVSNTVLTCDGTSWAASGAGAITPGTTTVGSSTDCFAYADASSLLQCDTNGVFNNSGAGNGVITYRKTPSGGAITSNFFSVAGTQNTTLTSSFAGFLVNVTSAGSSSQLTTAQATFFNPGYTGSSATVSQYVSNNVAGIASWSSASSITGAGNTGAFLSAIATTVGTNFGSFNYASGGNRNIGVYGAALTAKSSATHGGVVGLGRSVSGSSEVGFGGYFGLNTTVPTFIDGALVADNGAVAAPIIVARDNGAALPTTGATATWQIANGAWPKVGNGILTDATMTAETQGRASGGLIHSYTWTNAQVVALGAALTGDITVATLPAKTQVRNAYVVITGTAAGTTTLTVSCGDAIGGTPFTNYIVASDAQAAVNTVYGDAVAERGTSIDAEFYYLPSYTGTTLVTCHFIATVANLDQVTGSTGRVILETVVLP